MHKILSGVSRVWERARRKESIELNRSVLAMGIEWKGVGFLVGRGVVWRVEERLGGAAQGQIGGVWAAVEVSYQLLEVV
jgi:hypothetical protein